jgi:hypothetical protein
VPLVPHWQPPPAVQLSVVIVLHCVHVPPLPHAGHICCAQLVPPPLVSQHWPAGQLQPVHMPPEHMPMPQLVQVDPPMPHAL